MVCMRLWILSERHFDLCSKRKGTQGDCCWRGQRRNAMPNGCQCTSRRLLRFLTNYSSTPFPMALPYGSPKRYPVAFYHCDAVVSTILMCSYTCNCVPMLGSTMRATYIMSPHSLPVEQCYIDLRAVPRSEVHGCIDQQTRGIRDCNTNTTLKEAVTAELRHLPSNCTLPVCDPAAIVPNLGNSRASRNSRMMNECARMSWAPTNDIRAQILKIVLRVLGYEKCLQTICQTGTD